MDVFYADTIPLARENPHKIFPAVFAGFSPNDHTVQSNVFDTRTNWLISENTAFFAVRQKRTVPLVILTKKFEFLGRNVKARGEQYFVDSVSDHEKRAASAAPCV